MRIAGALCGCNRGNEGWMKVVQSLVRGLHDS